MKKEELVSLGLAIAEIAEKADWPETGTGWDDDGSPCEERGDMHVCLWQDTLPVIEVTTIADGETGGDYGADAGMRRMVIPGALPQELQYKLSALIPRHKLLVMIEDIGKYSRRLYGFKIE